MSNHLIFGVVLWVFLGSKSNGSFLFFFFFPLTDNVLPTDILTLT